VGVAGAVDCKRWRGYSVDGGGMRVRVGKPGNFGRYIELVRCSQAGACVNGSVESSFESTSLTKTTDQIYHNPSEGPLLHFEREGFMDEMRPWEGYFRDTSSTLHLLVRC